MRTNNQTLSILLLQMALPFTSSLVVFPLYALGKLTVNRPAAIWAVLFYPLIPSFALWAGIWDQFYPLVACSAALCLGIALIKRRKGFMFLSGLILGMGTFLSFGFIILLAPLGLWVTFVFLSQYNFRQKEFWIQIVVQGALFLSGLTFIWFLYQLVYGVSFFEILTVSMGFHLGLESDYWTWVFYHPYDFFLFFSIPLSILLFIAFFKNVRHGIKKPTRSSLFCIAFVLGLVVLVFSGSSRGEVSRVWLFLTPLAMLCAASILPKFSSRFSLVIGFLLIGQLLVFNSNLRVATTGMADPMPFDRQFAIPNQMEPASADFGPELSLLGFNLTESGSDKTELTLHWQANQHVAKPYTVFVHVLDSNQNFAAQVDAMPQNGVWPTTCWKPNEVVSDTFSFDLPPGQYKIYTGLYWFEDGQRVQIQNRLGPDPTDSRLFLSELEIN